MTQKIILLFCCVLVIAGCSGPITIQVITDDNGYDGGTVVVDGGAGCDRPYPPCEPYYVDDYYYDDYYYYDPGYYDGYVYYDDVYVDDGYYYDDGY